MEEIGKGHHVPVSIPARSVAQCPTSFVSAQSIDWVNKFHRWRAAKEATGAPVFSSLFETDSRTVDALIVLESERVVTDRELSKAYTSR